MHYIKYETQHGNLYENSDTGETVQDNNGDVRWAGIKAAIDADPSLSIDYPDSDKKIADDNLLASIKELRAAE